MTSPPRGSAESRVPDVKPNEDTRSDLDRHAEANATLAGLFRRVFIKGAR